MGRKEGSAGRVAVRTSATADLDPSESARSGPNGHVREPNRSPEAPWRASEPLRPTSTLRKKTARGRPHDPPTTAPTLDEDPLQPLDFNPVNRASSTAGDLRFTKVIGNLWNA